MIFAVHLFCVQQERNLQHTHTQMFLGQDRSAIVITSTYTVLHEGPPFLRAERFFAISKSFLPAARSKFIFDSFHCSVSLISPRHHSSQNNQITALLTKPYYFHKQIKKTAKIYDLFG